MGRALVLLGGALLFAGGLLMMAGGGVASATVTAGSGALEIVGAAKCSRLDLTTTPASITLKAGVRYQVLASVDAVYGVGFAPTDPATCTTSCGVEVPAKVPLEAALAPGKAFAPDGSTAPVVQARTATGVGRIQFCEITESRR